MDTNGCDWPVGHNARYPSPPPGITVAFNEYAFTVDGTPHRVWIAYVGRGRYYPTDHAPLLRPVLDDGVLDFRIFSADESFARLRLLWAVLTGTVASSSITHLREATEVTIDANGAPMALAVDGEALAGVRKVHYRVVPRALAYYSPQA